MPHGDGEQAGAAVLSRVQTRMFRGENGVLSPEEMRPWLRDPSDAHNPRQALITVENTMGYMAGSVYPQQRLDELRAFADSIGFRIHMDGARLWNAAVAAGLEPAAVARPADTVSVCFSKGLGAPVGSALAGSKETIARARRGRKLLGGGMRQAGVIAAGALYALNHHIERLHEDHERARRLGVLLAGAPGLALDQPVATNMVMVRVEHDNAPAVAAAINEAGVGCLALDCRIIRFVVHLQVDDDDIEQAGAAILRALDGRPGPVAHAMG